MTGVRSTAEANDFSSSLCAQTSSEAHPASYPMGTGGKEGPERDADQSSPLVQGLRMSRIYHYSPPCRLRGNIWIYLLYLLKKSLVQW
jgi:hypothetical protein